MSVFQTFIEIGAGLACGIAVVFVPVLLLSKKILGR
jgi:hypothetical protein